jgi:hypothetical protein
VWASRHTEAASPCYYVVACFLLFIIITYDSSHLPVLTYRYQERKLQIHGGAIVDLYKLLRNLVPKKRSFVPSCVLVCYTMFAYIVSVNVVCLCLVLFLGSKRG